MTRLVRAEWTKLRTVRRWLVTLGAAAGLTLLLGVLSASASGTDINKHPDFVVGPGGRAVIDNLHFLHQPLTGDGTVTVRVAAQKDNDPGARAGLMVKAAPVSGAGYVALYVTPGAGTRMQANFGPETDAGSGRWLRLTRSGPTVTGQVSSDGVSWREVGSARVADARSTVEVGLFVSSPGILVFERAFGSSSMGFKPTMGDATFDNLTGFTDEWADDEIGRNETDPGTVDEISGGLRMTGSGQIAPRLPEDDMLVISLSGVFIGAIMLGALGVVYVTSEYARGMVHTSFLAAPGRRPVLLAKAVVLGLVTFLIAAVTLPVTVAISRPILRDGGFAPPAFPEWSLTDPPVVRAMLGTAAMLALIAMLGVAVGAILRRGASAITVVIGALILPVIVSAGLPTGAARWLMTITPAAGFASQQSFHRPETPLEPWTMLPPGVGLAVLAGYVLATLALAAWLVGRRDA